MQCEIYKCSKKSETYLYVEKPIVRDELPGTLLDILGDLSLVMELEITPESRLASEDASQVLAQVQEQGFYLQLPPKI